MKLAQQYAQAFYMVIKTAKKTSLDLIISNLVRLLAEKGHQTLLPAIIREYKRIRVRTDKRDVPLLMCASKKEVSGCVNELKKYDVLGNEENINIVIDPKIIGGFHFKKGDLVIDGCYRKVLLNLYRKILA